MSTVDKESREQEPYMGVARVSRVTGSANLFDSDVEHNGFIELTISEADRVRSLSRHWIHRGRDVIKVRMTYIQWAYFVSSFGQGTGASCTISEIQGKHISEPPSPKPDATKFEKEMVDTAQDSLNALKSTVTKLETALVPKAKAPGKTELAEILSDLQRSLREFTQNMPFVESQFQEHIEEKLGEAKTEFEGYVLNRLHEMGLQAAGLAHTMKEAPTVKFITEGAEIAPDEQ